MVEYRASYVPGTEPPARPESSAGPADSSLGRGRFFGELSDPATLNRLIAYTDAEVGGEGPDAHQAFIESVLNRSVARNQPLATTLSGDYFPSETHRKADRSVSEGEIGAYSGAIGKVLGGSNITNYATGNASGDVGFNKGPQTAQFGNERFGQEGPDVGWWNKLGLVSSAQAQEAPQQVAQAKGISAPAVSDTQYRASTVGNAPLYRASVVPEVAPSETPVKGVEAPPVEGEPAPSESFEVTKGFKGAL
jgi:hypothetical protein